MRSFYHIALLAVLLCFGHEINAQRTYRPNSVLATGSWYKFFVKDAGICRVDVPFLNSLGINTGNLSSSAIRVFGNGCQMLDENNSTARPDDLAENAIMVVDGGDGFFNGSDYFLFYTPGADKWKKDPASPAFRHQKNIYGDGCFFYISIGGNGARINTAAAVVSNVNVTTYNARYFHELDTVNFLSSGKQWYGEEFANIPGKSVSRTFDVTIPGLNTAQPVVLLSDVVSRSSGSFSRFDVKSNGNSILQHNVAFTGTGVYDPFAVEDIQQSSFKVSQSSLSINYTYTPGSVNAQGWLNWFEINTRADLNMASAEQFFFRDLQSVAPGNTAKFNLQNATAATQVWDVTDSTVPVKMLTVLSGNIVQFSNSSASLHEYIAFNGNSYLKPVAIGKIDNQNLHNSGVTQLLIVAAPALITQAQRLAAYRTTKDNLRCLAVTTDEVYNEFSSGLADPTAIRDFVKMYFDKAAGDVTKLPRYLLLFGDASFDYKDRITGNTNLVPCYESVNSLEPLATYTSDDFFGFLNDADNINDAGRLNLLSIGIGRIPARNIEQAKNYVDKIINYSASESFGPWRNQATFVADDEDANLHLQDAEAMANTVASNAPVLDVNKIYLDAYKQQSGSGGSFYPDANTAINNTMFSGNLIWNYNGHGSYNRLAEEDILDQQIINGWSNANKLPLFITATCDFAPYDNPLLNSIGEDLLLRPSTGGIALMTTTRAVFAFSNKVINNNYLQTAVVAGADGKYLSLGESIKIAKNFTYQNYTDIINNRKFTLLGDPSLTLAYPVNKVITDSINGHTVSATGDTLKALGKYVISGKITDAAGNFLNSFNGTAYPVIFDKPQTITTLANDAGSNVTSFQSQTNILYKGKAKVTNGTFKYTFIVPKDINYQYGNGKVSYYADNGSIDGNGGGNIITGGINNSAVDDKTGPVIKAWLNDEKFISGGTCNETPILIVHVSDSSGINTSGLGIGHDLVAILDNDNNKIFELNDFYEADLDSYQSGKIHFQLPKLEAGFHTLKIKAWDIFNNSGQYELELFVAKDEELVVTHVLNYPNPFVNHTNFWFEHNHPGEDLHVSIRIFTVSGKLVKSIQQTINTPGNRSSEIEWDGRDDFGQKIGRGVYIYRFVVLYKNKKALIFEKMLIL